jgi:hypothetical protein
MQIGGQCGGRIKRYNETQETRAGEGSTWIDAYIGLPMLIPVSSEPFGSSSRCVGLWLRLGLTGN